MAMLFVAACATLLEVAGGAPPDAEFATIKAANVGPSKEYVFKQGNFLYIEGIINRGLYYEFKKAFAHDVDTVIVSSAGGQAAYAIKIGAAMRDRPQVKLIVQGVCLSACANFIFPSARQKVVLPNSIVGWHGGSYHRWRYHEMHGEKKSAKRELRNLKKERNYYRSLGADYQLVIDSGDVVGVRGPRYLTEYESSGARVEYMMMDSEYDFWAPSPAIIASYGIAIQPENFWYVDDAEAISRLLTADPENPIRVTTRSPSK